ncbi:hypothetical protein WB876_004402 [Vibrio vulnificus]
MSEDFEYLKNNLIDAVESLEKDFNNIVQLINVNGYDPELLKRLLLSISKYFGFSDFETFQYNKYVFEPAAQEAIIECGEYLLQAFLKVDKFKQLLKSYCEVFDSTICNPSSSLSFDMDMTFLNTAFVAVIKHFEVSSD